MVLALKAANNHLIPELPAVVIPEFSVGVINPEHCHISSYNFLINVGKTTFLGDMDLFVPENLNLVHQILSHMLLLSSLKHITWPYGPCHWDTKLSKSPHMPVCGLRFVQHKSREEIPRQALVSKVAFPSTDRPPAAALQTGCKRLLAWLP